MDDTGVDFFLETLNQLIMSSKVESIIKEKHQLESLEKEIKYMRGFLKDTEKKRNEHSEVMDVVRQIKDVVAEAENLIELFVVRGFKANYAHYAFHRHQAHLSLDLESVKNEIKSLTAEVKQIYHNNMHDITGVAGTKLEHSFSKSEGGSSSSGGSNTSKVVEQKVVVGFKEDVEHPLTSNAFELHAWVDVSQDYDNTIKKNLLIHILELAPPNKHGDYEKSSEDKLGEDTHKFLKGKKYLIVMDDIWGIEAWNDIQSSLPKECNDSKVLFTSRLPIEPNSIHCIPHCLPPLQKSCGWEALRNKVFKKKRCPPELVGIGYHIAEKCEGLPLAIDVIAGILALEDKTLDVWEKVYKYLSSIIAKSHDSCMEILELCYNHLPLHLKACLVYIGGFPEDSEILVRDLIWLWIAEGFIQQDEWEKSLEDIAKDYLRSLMDRSLVMVVRKRSFGGIKACQIHVLLRKLCLRKVEEDNFLMPIYQVGTFSSSVATKHRRVFIGCQFFDQFFLEPCPRNLRSFLCLSLQNFTHLSFETNLSFFVKNFELLRVLHFISTECQGKIGSMYHLRYLALLLPNDISDFVSPFDYLFNLETLNLRSNDNYWKTIPLPLDIFKMVKLRHLYAKRGVFKYHLSCLYPEAATEFGFDCSSKLDSLQTLHAICPCEVCQKFLVRTPNLRKLGFYGELISNDFVLMLPDLEFWKYLETLSIHHSRIPNGPTTLPPVLKFPPSITRLTLKNTGLDWDELSILQTLPNLEVLKLSKWACRGLIWSTIKLVGFSQLKYLQLQDLGIEEWNASKDQFPRLEVLVVKYCPYLERIPIDFANLNDLCEIEVRMSSRTVEESAREIQEERRNKRGDDDWINLVAISNT